MLDAVTIVSLILAVLCAVYAFIALIQDYNLSKEVKKGFEKTNEAAEAASNAVLAQGGDKSLAENVQPQAALGGAAEYLKALASFAEGLSKLKQGVAALVIALAFALLAVTAAGIDEKVEDSDGGSTDTALVVSAYPG